MPAMDRRHQVAGRQAIANGVDGDIAKGAREGIIGQARRDEHHFVDTAKGRLRFCENIAADHVAPAIVDQVMAGRISTPARCRRRCTPMALQ